MRLWLGVLISRQDPSLRLSALWHQAGRSTWSLPCSINHLQRFSPRALAAASPGSCHRGHHHPFYYNVTGVRPPAFLPWGILLVPVPDTCIFEAGEAGLRRDTSALKGPPLREVLVLRGPYLLSVASTKSAPLISMPIFAPISMLTAFYMAHTLKTSVLGRWSKVFLWAFDIMLLVIGLAMTPAWSYVKRRDLWGAAPLTAFPSSLSRCS